MFKAKHVMRKKDGSWDLAVLENIVPPNILEERRPYLFVNGGE